MEPQARQLLFHGAIVLLIGLLCGAPYARAINRQAPAPRIHSWRVAHLSLPIGAGLMIAIAGVLSALAGSPMLKWGIALSFIVSSYAFCLALPLGAIVGHRGLSSQGPMPAKLVYAGNMIGAWASLLGTLALVYASYLSL